jgi:hypothetical protein
MKIGICDSADIDGIVTEIDDSPADDIVLMFIVAADRPAEDPVHEQAAIFARSGKIGWSECASLGSLLAPFMKHKNLGLREAFLGIGELRLPVYSPVCHFMALTNLIMSKPDPFLSRTPQGFGKPRRRRIEDFLEFL